MEKELLSRYEKLVEYLKSFGSVAVAFSSGVDSTFLLYAAKEALGDKAIAVTTASCVFPVRELDEARSYCDKLNVKHIIVDIKPLQIDGFAANPKDRCYICKKEIFNKIEQAARSNGIDTIVEGSNLDDNGDYRPGLVAVKELGIKSPLREIGFTKQEIRDLSEYLNIPTWNKPSYACLASRFPYGEIISEQKLQMVDKAEQLLLDMGFSQFRVRIHGDVARIELNPSEFGMIMADKARQSVYKAFKEYGFSYVALDLYGYRTGSMNETLIKE